MAHLITEHIDTWTSAQEQRKNGGRGNNSNGQSQYGIKKLRELILELAVRGKLVPQNPNDEPASELLKKIAKEKTQLIKEGKIKKQKPLPEISDNEKLFELPMGWEWARLGFFSEVKGGKRLPAGHSFSLVETPFVYIQVTNMKDGGITKDNLKYITEDTQSEISRYTISKDDLYITIAGTIGAVGIVPDYFNGMNLTENAAKIVFSEIDKAWLQKALSSEALQQQFTDKTNQLAQPKLALHRVASSCIALPPLAEQRRIVTKVDELMALCDQLEQHQTDSNQIHETLVETLLTTLTSATDHKDLAEAWQRIADNFDILFTTEQSIDKLKQTVLQLAVMGKLVHQDPNDEPASELLKKIAKEKARLIKEGKIKKQKPLPEITYEEKTFELPKGWEWVRLGDLTTNIHYGYTSSADKRINNVRLLRITDIQNDSVNWGSVPGCKIDDSKISDYKLENGDILIARTGGTIGKSYLVSDIDLCAVFASYLIRLRHLKEMYPRFVKTYLGSQLYWEQLYAKSMGTGQPNVNGNSLKNLVFALPPRSEQHRIVAKVDELMALCNKLKDRLIKSQSIEVKLADAMINQAVA